MIRTNDITYYSVDVEASGPVPGLFNLVSIGATAVVEQDGAWTEGPSFYVELKPVFEGQEEEANAIHGISPERLAAEGLEPAEALRRLNAFVASSCATGTKPVFVGHVAVFDWMYVACYYAWCGIENPFGYKAIDTKSLAMGLLRLPWFDTSKEVLCERLGIPPQDPGTVHRADADAQHQAQLLIALLERALG